MSEEIQDTISEENTAQENQEEAVEASEAETTPDVDKDAEIAKLQAIVKRKNEKLEKFEALAQEPQEVKTEAPQPANVEETVLRAQGLETEKLEQLKKVAAANGTDLLAAKDDELYQAWEAKFDADQKKAKAALGASKGSGSSPQKKDFSTPGLSKDEHKEMFRKAVGV